MRAKAPFGFRYQYLAGGVNTGSGWATWNAGRRASSRYYVQDSRRQRHHSRSSPTTCSTSPRPAQAAASERRRLDNLQNTADDARLLQRPQALLPAGRRRSADSRSSCTSSPTSGATCSSGSRGDDAGDASRSQVGCDRPAGAGRPAGQRPRLRPGDRPAARRATRRTSCSATTSAPGAPAPTSSSATPATPTVDALGARAGSLLPLARRRLRPGLRRVQRPRRRLQRSTSTATAARSWWDAADFGRHVRFLARFVDRDRQADRAVADPATATRRCGR